MTTRYDLDLIRSAVGARPWVEPSNWGYRNRYSSPTEGPAKEGCERLVAEGLMSRSGDNMYHATEAGCDAIGLTAEQKRRAFEP